MVFIITPFLNWLLHRVNYASDFSLAQQQLQSFQDELLGYQSKKQHYNRRVHVLPSIVTRVLIVIGVVVSITTLFLFGFSQENRVKLYTTLATIFIVHITVLIFMRRLVRSYYRRNMNNTEMSIEKLLIKQRETLEQLKRDTNYYKTNLLVKKYEASIAHIQEQLLRNGNDFNIDQIINNSGANDNERSNVRNSKDRRSTASSSSSTTTTYSVSRGTQTDIMMNFDIIQPHDTRVDSDQRLGIELTPLSRKTKSFDSITGTLPLSIEDSSPVPQYIMPPDGDEKTPTKRPRRHSLLSPLRDSRSLQSQQNTNDQISSNSDSTPATRNQNENADISLKQEQMKQMYLRLRSEFAHMEQRRQELDQRELELNKKQILLQQQIKASNQQPLTPNKLFSQSFTSRYRKEDMQAKNFGSSWFDRLVDKLMGQSPEECLALICDKCHAHNGLLMLEDGDQVQRFRCWSCGFHNSQLLIQNTQQSNVNNNDIPNVSQTPRQLEQTRSESEDEHIRPQRESNTTTTKEISKHTRSVSSSTVDSNNNEVDFDELVNSDDVSNSSDDDHVAADKEFEAMHDTRN